MKQYDILKSKTIDELARWLGEYTYTDNSPHIKWFGENYCEKCEPEIVHLAVFDIGECKCGWCEIHDKCKFFQELDDIPDNEEIIKLWLESEAE